MVTAVLWVSWLFRRLLSSENFTILGHRNERCKIEGKTGRLSDTRFHELNEVLAKINRPEPAYEATGHRFVSFYRQLRRSYFAFAETIPFD